MAETPWHASVLTLFPDMFPGPLAASLTGKALEQKLWRLDAIDIRDFASGKHRSVDERPAGGGPGMVMRVDVLARAIDQALETGPDRPRILLSARGAPLTQKRVRRLAQGPGALLVCGRFEGVDERIVKARRLEEISIGDFVLAGGEVAAMALIEACVRLLPGVMGAEASGAEESFETGLLEYPHYTRPQSFEGLEIPAVLTSGHHGAVERWRREEAERLTRQRRPDLWKIHEKEGGRKPE